MKRLGAHLRVYSTFIRIAFLGMLAYRLRYYTGILTYVLFVSVHYFIWKAIFFGQPAGGRINGFTLSEMVTYIAVGWIARSFYFSDIDTEIDELVRSGQVSVFLLRPVNFHLMLLSQAAGESMFRIAFFTGPIALAVLWLFPVSLPAGAAAAILFSVATLFSFIIMAEINFIIGVLAFFTKSIQGIARAKYMLLQLFSGLLMPLAFFPDWFRVALEVLPFKNITYVPLQIYLGKVSAADMGPILLNQIAWTLALVGLSQVLLKKALRRLTLQGG